MSDSRPATWPGQRVLVTGANGFVGSHLVRELVARGASVIANVRPGADMWRLEPVASSISVLEAELLDIPDTRLIGAVDVVYHLAAAGTNQADRDAELMLRTNVMGTYRVLELARRIRARRLVCAGTGFEYGAESKAVESRALCPVTAYAATKAAASLTLQAFARSNPFPVVVLRTFSVYGPGQARHFVVPYAVANAVADRPIRLRGATQRRDFVYIDDAISAYLKAADTACPAGECYNVGSGREVTVREVVEEIVTLSGSKSEVVVSSGNSPHDASSADTSKSKRELGWQAETALADGLKRTIEWFADNRTLYDSRYPNQEPFG